MKPLFGNLAMTQNNFNALLLVALVSAASTLPALARGNDLTVKDGFGEEVKVTNGFFGHKTRVVKDRLGDGYAQKKGWFGSEEQDANVLGNSFKRKKGILGGSDLEGSTIFGDKVVTKKGIFGRRKTEVDVSGSASAIKALFNKGKDGTQGGSGAGILGGLLGAGKSGLSPAPVLPKGTVGPLIEPGQAAAPTPSSQF
jgi:hypothetical protein